jgi:hypothetical protein
MKVDKLKRVLQDPLPRRQILVSLYGEVPWKRNAGWTFFVLSSEEYLQ